MLLPAFLIHVSNSIDDDAKCGLDGIMKIKFVLAGYVTLLSFTFVSSVLPADTKSAIGCGRYLESGPSIAIA